MEVLKNSIFPLISMCAYAMEERLKAILFAARAELSCCGLEIKVKEPIQPVAAHWAWGSKDRASERAGGRPAGFADQRMMHIVNHGRRAWSTSWCLLALHAANHDHSAVLSHSSVCFALMDEPVIRDANANQIHSLTKYELNKGVRCESGGWHFITIISGVKIVRNGLYHRRIDDI